MADYPPGYDPSQADYISARDQAIGGLIGLSAFAMIGVGAFFTTGAIAAGTVAEGITINGTTYYGVTQATAEFYAGIGTGAITQEAATALVGSAVIGGGSALDAAAIIALDHFDISRDARFWQNFGDYMSLFIPGYSGPGIPAGYPGFPGVGYPNPFGTGGFVCYVPYFGDDTQEYCFWEE